MANGLTTTGIVLTILSVLIIIISMVFGAIGVSGASDENMVVIAREYDFSSRGTQSYQYQMSSDEALNTIEVTVESRSTNQIPMTLKVFSEYGTEIFNQRGTTPTTFVVDISGELSDYLDIVLEFDSDQTAMSDVTVTVKGDSISGDTLILCCLSMSLPVVGIIMLITGVILIVVGYKKKSKDVRARSQQTLPPDYYSRPSNSNQGRPAGNIYRNPQQNYEPRPPPVRTGTVQRDPNPYYRGNDDPRAAPKPPDEFDYRNDW